MLRLDDKGRTVCCRELEWRWMCVMVGENEMDQECSPAPSVAPVARGEVGVCEGEPAGPAARPEGDPPLAPPGS